MSRKRRNWIFGLTAGSAVAVAALFGHFIILKMEAQAIEPVVKFSQGLAPIKAVSFDLGRRTMPFGRQFSAPDDWFKDLSVNLENSSGKTVTYVAVAVTFSPPKGYEKLLPFRFSITKGRKSDALHEKESGFSLESSTDSGKGLGIYNIRPDDPEREYAWNRASLDRIGFPKMIGEIQLQIEEVVFRDGTMWSSGHWYRLDPGDSEKLIRIDETRR